MEPKPISKLNITALKALIASSESASEREKAKQRLDKLQAKKPVFGWSKEDAEIDTTKPDPITAVRLLRQYYASKFSNPVSEQVENMFKQPINDITKTVIIEDTPITTPREVEDVNISTTKGSNGKNDTRSLLSDLENDYEIIEINIKLVKKKW
jgi:hypothetical protein